VHAAGIFIQLLFEVAVSTTSVHQLREQRRRRLVSQALWLHLFNFYNALNISRTLTLGIQVFYLQLSQPSRSHNQKRTFSSVQDCRCSPHDHLRRHTNSYRPSRTGSCISHLKPTCFSTVWGDTDLGFTLSGQNIHLATKGDYGFLGNKPDARRAYGG